MQRAELRFEERYGIVICLACRIALTGETRLIIGHLRKRHRYKNDILQAVEEEAERLPLLARHLVPQPTAGCPAINGLSINRRGLTCLVEGCDSKPFYQQRAAVAHCMEVHSIRPKLAKARWLRTVAIQTMFKHPETSYFIVTLPAAAVAASTAPAPAPAPAPGNQSQRAVMTAVAQDQGSGGQERRRQAVLDQIARSEAAYKESFAKLTPQTNEAAHPWITRSGFAALLADQDTVEIRQLIECQTTQHRILRDTVNSVLLAVANKTVEGSQQCGMSRQCGQILKSFHKEYSVKPFRRVQADHTMQVYSRYWTGLLILLLQLYCRQSRVLVVRQCLGGKLSTRSIILLQQLTDQLDLYNTQQSEIEQASRPSRQQAPRRYNRQETASRSSGDSGGSSSSSSDSDSESAPRPATRMNDVTVQEQLHAELMSGIKETITVLSMCLVRHRLGGMDSRSPVFSYVAIRALHVNGSWTSPHQCTSYLSGIIHCMQLWLLEWVIRAAADTEDTELEAEDSDESTAWSSRQEKIMEHEAEQFLRSHTSSPISTVNRIRLLAFHASKSFVPHARTTVSMDMQITQHEDTLLRLADWRRLLADLLTASEDLLSRRLLFGVSCRAACKAANLYDNINESQPMFNFVDLAQNGLLVERRKLLDLVTNDVEVRSVFVKPGDGSTAVEFDHVAIKEYLAVEQQLLKLLAVLIHTTSGLPARVPELLAAQYRNSETLRNIFLFSGRLLLCSFHAQKNQWRIGVRPVVRCLPDEVASILIPYIIYVTPVSTFLRHVGGLSIPETARGLLFADEKGAWKDDKIRYLFQMTIEQRIGVSLPISHWRHMAIALDRAGLQGRTAGLYRLVESWNINDKASMLEADEGDEVDESEPAAVDCQQGGQNARLHALQASHSILTHNTVYGIDQRLPEGVTDVLMTQFIRVSDDFQAIFGLGIKAAESTRISRKRSGSPLSAVTVAGRRLLGAGSHLVVRKALWTWDGLLVAMKKMLGPHAEPRNGLQRDALRLVIDCPAEAIIILPTGGGKTLLFTLPTLLLGAATTVVVVPLISLRQDLLRRCREWGLDYAAWDDGLLARDIPPKLLFVSVEQAVDRSFLTFLAELEHKDRLDRVVFDEAHLLLTASRYRESLRQIVRLRQTPSSFICLTGTLPPVGEFDLKTAVGFSVCRVLRGGSDRANLRYQVLMTPPEQGKSMDESQLALLQRQLFHAVRECQDSDRIICYVRTIARGEELAEQINSYLYHSRLQGKDRQLQDWMQGKGSRIIVATSALSAGFDYPSIRFVFHLDAPTGMVDYAQETGRAGRDGLLAECIVILIAGRRSNWDAGKQLQSPFIIEDFKALDSFLRMQGCLREQLKSYLSGEAGGSCTQSKSTLCGFCSQPQVTASNILNRANTGIWSADRSAQLSIDQLDTPSTSSTRQFTAWKEGLLQAYTAGFRAALDLTPSAVPNIIEVSSSSTIHAEQIPAALASSTHVIQPASRSSKQSEAIQIESLAVTRPPFRNALVYNSMESRDITSSRAAETAWSGPSIEQMGRSNQDITRLVGMDVTRIRIIYDRQMQEWESACIPCSLQQRKRVPKQPHHAPCLLGDGSSDLHAKIEHIRGSIVFERGAACYRCGHITKLCGRPFDEQSGKGCKSPTLVWEVLAVLFFVESTACKDLIAAFSGPLLAESKFPTSRPIGMEAFNVCKHWLGLKCQLPKAGYGFTASKASLLVFHWVAHLDSLCSTAGTTRNSAAADSRS